MAETRDGGTAFPAAMHPSQTGAEAMNGMTLRDYFAGQALAALVRDRDAVRVLNNEPDWPLERSLAFACYRMADAMLTARDEVSP